MNRTAPFRCRKKTNAEQMGCFWGELLDGAREEGAFGGGVGVNGVGGCDLAVKAWKDISRSLKGSLSDLPLFYYMRQLQPQTDKVCVWEHVAYPRHNKSLFSEPHPINCHCVPFAFLWAQPAQRRGERTTRLNRQIIRRIQSSQRESRGLFQCHYLVYKWRQTGRICS